MTPQPCKCVNITPQTKECYDQMIMLDIPPHMEEYRNNTITAGRNPQICIDPCIVEEIKDLWNLGIITYGCCCGHNKLPPIVTVDERDINAMLMMGYIPDHWESGRKDTFRLKSIESNATFKKYLTRREDEIMWKIQNGWDLVTNYDLVLLIHDIERSDKIRMDVLKLTEKTSHCLKFHKAAAIR